MVSRVQHRHRGRMRPHRLRTRTGYRSAKKQTPNQLASKYTKRPLTTYVPALISSHSRTCFFAWRKNRPVLWMPGAMSIAAVGASCIPSPRTMRSSAGFTLTRSRHSFHTLGSNVTSVWRRGRVPSAAVNAAIGPGARPPASSETRKASSAYSYKYHPNAQGEYVNPLAIGKRGKTHELVPRIHRLRDGEEHVARTRLGEVHTPRLADRDVLQPSQRPQTLAELLRVEIAHRAGTPGREHHRVQGNFKAFQPLVAELEQLSGVSPHACEHHLADVRCENGVRP